MTIDYMQCRLNAWGCWAVARGSHEHRGPMLIYVCCVQQVFNVYNKYMINFIDIYICIPVSGWVGRGPFFALPGGL